MAEVEVEVEAEGRRRKAEVKDEREESDKTDFFLKKIKIVGLIRQ